MNQLIGGTNRRWRDLDSQNVLFKGNFAQGHDTYISRTA